MFYACIQLVKAVGHFLLQREESFLHGGQDRRWPWFWFLLLIGGRQLDISAMLPGQHKDLLFGEPLLAWISAVHLLRWVDVCPGQPSTKGFRIDFQQLLTLPEIEYAVHLCSPMCAYSLHWIPLTSLNIHLSPYYNVGYPWRLHAPSL